MKFPSSRPLEFLEPRLAGRDERRKGAEALLLPTYPDYIYGSGIKRPKPSASTYRNLMAWYLRAAGLSGQEIGQFLSISPSRANQVAHRAQVQACDSALCISRMRSYAAATDITGDILQAHMLRAMQHEMAAAEYCLSSALPQDTYAISGALRIGRQRYLDAYAGIQGLKCPCPLCTGFRQESLAPYWDT